MVVAPHIDPTALFRESPVRWRLEQRGGMLVPGIVFASARLIEALDDRSLDQVAAVAMLPGVVEASYAMPDVHLGYGFPIGGVAATDADRAGVVSPGGVGFDISCGVRLLASPFDRSEVEDRLGRLMDALAASTPRGMGRGAVHAVQDRTELTRLLLAGAEAVVELGGGEQRDLDRCEDGGRLEGADPDQVSDRAVERGLGQVGSLGSGNHFLEVQVVEEIHDAAAADAFGLRPGQVCVMVHTGSRGLGHQVCSDHIRHMHGAMGDHGIEVPDEQLACAPVDSTEGRAYLAALAVAANFARANRQWLTEAARDAFAAVGGSRQLELIYDVSHNLAKLETHQLEGHPRRLCVHRKGATRAFPPGSDDLPGDLRTVGQPVLIPGSMGTSSHVMAGVAPSRAFASCAHGAGRTMSRHQAKRRGQGGARLRDELVARGVEVRAGSLRDLPEEAPLAYKDVDEVVAVSEQAGLARRVAKLVPIGVVKG